VSRASTKGSAWPPGEIIVAGRVPPPPEVVESNVAVNSNSTEADIDAAAAIDVF